MRRTLVATVVMCAQIARIQPVLADRGSATFDDAISPPNMDRRDLEMVVGFMDRYHYSPTETEFPRWCYLDPWEKDGDEHPASKTAALIASTLFSVVHRNEIAQNPLNGADWSARIIQMMNRCGDVARLRENLVGDPNATPPKKGYLDSIRVLDDVGTSSDYDMDLMGLINLLYLLSHDRDLLASSDDLFRSAYNILCQDADGNGCEAEHDYTETDLSWDGLEGTGYLTFKLSQDYLIAVLGESILGQYTVRRAETENHVLMIYTWNYLATTWILWHAMHANAPQWVLDWRDRGMAWMNTPGNLERFYEPILQALGRVVHGGLFETNSRPYQEFTLLAILTLAIYADPFSATPPDSPDWPHGYQAEQDVEWYSYRVRQAARNALHTIMAKFAFQSLHGKRSAPMRRKHKYRQEASFYQSNRVINLFGLMTGAYEYDDCTSADRVRCPLLRYPLLGEKSKLAWVALARLAARWDPLREGYELPKAIQGHHYDRRPYFARWQHRTSKQQYPFTLPLVYLPRYFTSDTEMYLGDDFRGFPELYFGTGDLILAAGGMHDRFYENDYFWGIFAEDAKDYRFFARPTMLFPRGDFGYQTTNNSSLPGELLWSDIGDVTKDNVLVMRGQRDEWWNSECNVWVYKSFTYGYNYENTVESVHADKWAQYYPPEWETQQPYRRVQIENALFRLFYFGPGDLWKVTGGPQSDPYYLILSWVGKDGRHNFTKPEHYNFRRGFVEVVPGHLYGSLAELETELRAWHDPTFNYLTGEDDEDDIPYRYVTMSSHERLTLDPEMGYIPGLGEECRNGITKIERLAHPGLGPQGSDDPAWWVEADKNDLLLPDNVRSGKNRRYLPLGAVWQLDGQYRHTGRMFLEEKERGHLVVRRPTTKESSTTEDPIPAWDCLVINSHDYTNPSEFDSVVDFYEQCDAAGFDRYKIVDIDPLNRSACAVTLDGGAWCWGDNTVGQLGTGNTLSSFAPKEVIGLTEVTQIEMGAAHACALQADGSVLCWGQNGFGQLGNDTTTNSLEPVTVKRFNAGDLRARRISAGPYHTCTVDNLGSVACWGMNTFGQIGNHQAGTYAPTAMRVVLPAPAVAVAAGTSHTCAVLSTAEVWCWGRNDLGQLGNGTLQDSDTPVQVVFGAKDHIFTVPNLTAGHKHTCVVAEVEYNIRRSYCWGSNSYGRLGQPGSVDKAVYPMRLHAFGPNDNSSQDVVELSAGGRHTCARTEAGEGYCWGDNTAGQLGDMQPSSYEAMLVGGLTGVRQISAGTVHTCAVDATQHAWCWGANTHGQLGAGIPPNSAIQYFPEEVAWP